MQSVVDFGDAAATSLVVGVTSHRDLVSADIPGLRRQIRDSLTWLQTAFPDLSLVILSPLAEGGDQLVAEVGLELGARLIVPLALPPELYAEDFSSAQSRAQFERLLAQGELVRLPLADGDLRTPGTLRDRQYLLAGLYVANHCHLLVALWDGSEDGGVGGTAQIVRYYLGGPLPGARRASDNLRQMLAGDDDSLVLHVPVRRQSNGSVTMASADVRWLTSSGRISTSSEIPRDYRRIFERMQTFERDRLRHIARTPVD